jgi:hypothetical protein
MPFSPPAAKPAMIDPFPWSRLLGSADLGGVRFQGEEKLKNGLSPWLRGCRFLTNDQRFTVRIKISVRYFRLLWGILFSHRTLLRRWRLSLVSATGERPL